MKINGIVKCGQKKIVTVKAGKYMTDTFETCNEESVIYAMAKKNKVKVLSIVLS